MLLGTYERAGVPWSAHTTPWDFGQDLLPNDLERIAPSVSTSRSSTSRGCESAGIRKIVNGPFTFAPDGNPLIGPIKGLQNYWVACGVMAGFSQGGGVGLSLANWMVDGDPGADIWAMDVARYGDWANASLHERESARELLATLPHPLSERRTRGSASAAHDADLRKAARRERGVRRLLRARACPVVRAQEARRAHEDATFRRSNAHPHVGEECRAVREAVRPDRDLELRQVRDHGTRCRGLAGTASWPASVPAVGRIALSPMLNERGRLIGDFTLCRVDEERFFVVGTYAAEVFYMRWFERHLPPTAACTVRPCAMEYLGLSIAGPAIPQRCCRSSWTRTCRPAAFPFLSFAQMDVGMVPALVGRVSFTGELGYEIWVTAEYLRALYDLLREGRQGHGMRYSVAARSIRCASRRASATGRASSGRSTDRTKRASVASSISTRAGVRRPRGRGGREGEWRRTQADHAGGRCEGCRRDRRRADLARRPSGRLGHLGRLRPQRRPIDRARLRREGGGRRDDGLRGRADGRTARGRAQPGPLVRPDRAAHAGLSGRVCAA